MAEAAVDPGALSRRPSAALSRFVTTMSGYDLNGIDVVHHGLPSTELTFILAIGHPLRVGWSADRTQSNDFQAMVSGLHTSPAYIFPTPDHAGVQLGLTTSGARALLGVPAAELRTELVDLQELWSSVAAQLAERLAGYRTWAERFDTLERELMSRLRADEPAIRPELSWAWHQLVHRGATHTVGLAAEIGWSRGYFARLFAAEFGLKPKETARIVRFTQAKGALGEPGATLAGVASEVGYADQAHLTREWRRLAGCTPTDWQREMLAFVQDSGSEPVQD